MRLILLIDMDYFYVACEELRRPDIKDKPAIVGSDPKQGQGRGVVMTCNYAARKFGLRSGMPISMAYRIKPDAVYIPADFEYYEEVSRRVMSLVKAFADRFEQVSVDEAYMDISRKISSYDEALAYARKLQGDVRDKLGLPCSIGIGTNKLIAKMACDKAKPNGIKLVEEEKASAFISQLPVGELYGVGKRSEERLVAMGYKTIAELADANPQDLREAFGTFSIELHKSANALDDSPVVENYEIKSIGRETTFAADTNNQEEVINAIRRLSEEVIKEVAKNDFYFKVITIKLRYSDFDEHLKSRSIKNSKSASELMNVSTELYLKNADKARKLRKIGVRVSGLTKSKGQKSMGEFTQLSS